MIAPNIPQLDSEIDTKFFDPFEPKEPFESQEENKSHKQTKSRKRDIQFIGYTYKREIEK